MAPTVLLVVDSFAILFGALFSPSPSATTSLSVVGIVRALESTLRIAISPVVSIV